jgi:glucose-6-phosphate 1-epimerase
VYNRTHHFFSPWFQRAMANHNFIGELEYIEVSNDAACAKIALQGAHIFHFQALGKRPLIWLSELSKFETGNPIRGGIPICWPWFGAHDTKPQLPNHGFARTALWEHTETLEISNTETKVTLTLADSSDSIKLWPYLFELRLEIHIGSELRLSLMTINRDSKAMAVTCALHTYLSVNDVSNTKINGLDNKPYYDKVDNCHKTQTGSPLFVEEVDRIYQRISEPLKIYAPKVCANVKTQGSQTMVIWNPGKTLASTMSDVSDYRTMLCVESAALFDDAMMIPPGESQTLSSVISYEGK